MYSLYFMYLLQAFDYNMYVHVQFVHIYKYISINQIKHSVGIHYN